MLDPHLRVLRAVDHHGTLAAAAQALGYTPSAVSYQLRQLATDLGVELLAPAGRGIRLTQEARIVLRHAELLQGQVERAYADLARSGDDPSGSYTLCGFSTAATHLLPPAAAAVQERYPRATTRLREAEPSRCFELLLDGDADLALVTNTALTPPMGDERFHQQPLLDDPLDLVVPEGHPLTREPRVTLADAAEEAWIVGDPGTTYHHLVMTACMTAGFTPDVAHHANEWDTGTAMVAHGLGVILVPRMARLHAWAVQRVPLHGDPTPARRILAATRAGHEAHPVVAHALEAIVATATSLPHSRRWSGGDIQQLEEVR